MGFDYRTEGAVALMSSTRSYEKRHDVPGRAVPSLVTPVTGGP
jgi:hypothetical protein